MFKRPNISNTKSNGKNKVKEKNRKRNKIINFRVSQEELDLINKKIEMSMLTKQEYFIEMLTNHKVEVFADYRVVDAISKEIFLLAKVIKKFGQLDDQENEILNFVLELYEEIKKEKASSKC
ncbi:hypothetical protein EPT55_03375 [Fusobacterium necrophorum]|uniref:plasmid mobilization protein n=1 Tax=Fusobacterium necrophorum TaxID=859 RepID=UPI001012685C|nr:hypothetical protein [Fusobacterium necrophorum]RXZ28634.1 hypothetical protein EPT55_03375 [Fusobacterium necrophorum]